MEKTLKKAGDTENNEIWIEDDDNGQEATYNLQHNLLNGLNKQRLYKPRVGASPRCLFQGCTTQFGTETRMIPVCRLYTQGHGQKRWSELLVSWHIVLSPFGLYVWYMNCIHIICATFKTRVEGTLSWLTIMLKNVKNCVKKEFRRSHISLMHINAI